MLEIIDFVDICSNANEKYRKMELFIKTCEPKLIRSKTQDCIKFTNGMRLYFITIDRYYKWRIGRKYLILNDKSKENIIYYGGIPCGKIDRKGGSS